MKRSAISCLCVGCLLVFTACSGGGSSKAAAPTTTAAGTEPGTTAASSETTSAPATAVPLACDLVPQAKADTVMGTKMLAGVAVADTGVNSCTYAGDPNGPTAQFEVYVSPSAKNIYDADVSLQHTFTDVAGVGDESHEEDYAIFFRKGTNWVALRVSSLDDWSTFKPRVEALAKEIATQI